MSESVTNDSNDEQYEQRIRNLKEFDLGPVTERMEYKLGYDNAEELEMKFRRFSKMVLDNPDKAIAPEEDLDEYWHQLILDTVRYEKFCEQVFGGFMHHVPGDPEARDIEEYKERVAAGERDETDAFCKPRVEDKE